MDESSTVDQKKQKTGRKLGVVGHHGASEVWNYFAKNLITGTNKYSGTCVCNFCAELFDAPSSRGTNKLWHHLKKSCKQFPGFEGDKTQSLISFTENQVGNWKFDQERCRKALVEMIILCELPFSHVEKDGFRLFCETLQPKFHVVSRSTITRDCIQMFHEEKQKLKDYFKVASTRVCITTDMWTSIQNLGYIVLTAHFVDKNWRLQKKIINFRVLPHPHKGEAIAKSVESCLMEWGLEKVLTITLDNAKNNDKCVLDLRRRLNRRSGLLLGGDFLHVRCFAHVINLVVREGIDEAKTTIKRLRRSVKYVRSGPSRMQLFKKIASDEKVSTKKSLCLDVKTRWNSTYLMIDAALEFEKVFDRLEEQDSNYRNECDVMGLLNESDWKQIKSLHTFLEDFYELTKRVSGSKYVTSNTYFDELTQVKELLMDNLDGDDTMLCDMVKKMDAKFEKYCNFDSLNLMLVVAIVLDPRYKMQYVEFWYSGYLDKLCHYTQEEKSLKFEDFVGRLNNLMNLLYEHYKFEDTPVVSIDSLEKEGDTSMVGKGIKRHIRKEEFRGVLKRKDRVEALSDLDKYMSDGIEDDRCDFDVLSWWHGKLATYCSLSMMARDILAIPITSVASECAFSTAGRVLDPFRSSLTPNIVESLVCTQDWLRSRSTDSIGVEENLETLEEIERVLNEEMYSMKIN